MARYESLHVALGASRNESVIVNDPILNDLGVGEEFMAVRQKPRYRVLRVVKHWRPGPRTMAGT